MLFGKRGPSNGVDKNAFALICLNSCGREEVVDQVPQNISKVVPLYFSLSLPPSLSLSLPHCYLEPEVTRKRVNSGGGNGLGILTRFRFHGPEKAMQWLETRLTKIEEQLKESVNYYLK